MTNARARFVPGYNIASAGDAPQEPQFDASAAAPGRATPGPAGPETARRHRSHSHCARICRTAAHLLLSIAILCGGPARAPDHEPAPTVTVTMNGVAARAELADTPASQQHGLMNRRELENNHGMAFVFETPNRYCVWMKDTPLALTVAFVDDQARIVSIEDMAPRSDTRHCALRPSAYALEMPQGWFARNNIQPGDHVEGLPVRAPS